MNSEIHIPSNESKKLIEEALIHYQEYLSKLYSEVVTYTAPVAHGGKIEQTAILNNIIAKNKQLEQASREVYKLFNSAKQIPYDPNLKWNMVTQLPPQFPDDRINICVVVWQDSERASDQGVEITTLEVIREGKYNTERTKDAYWRSLSDAFEPESEWQDMAKLPAKAEFTIDDWNERYVIAYKEATKTTYEATTLYQVRAGDFPAKVVWLSVMDAPPMLKS